MKNEEAEYLNWLVARINVVPNKNFGVLLRELYRWEFYSGVPHDEDRGADGMAIRNTWADEAGYKRFGDIDFGPPRILETIVGIALRVEDRIFGGPWADEWDYKRIFWDLINNLGLIEYDGILTSLEYDEVGTVLRNFLEKPSRDKFPNIFVFSVTPKNLKKMNLWSQMGMYIQEKWPGNTYL